MKALVCEGPQPVAVEDVPDARIERPTDVLVRVTSTHICGSGLPMYEGRTTREQGRVLGHETLGVVVETGEGVYGVHVGDRISLRFNIGCGFCENGERGSSTTTAPLLPSSSRTNSPSPTPRTRTATSTAANRAGRR
ncbi:alcohol dehydrogenase catalytic domain-containing protein [Streptomyces sp. NRRL F-5630]|uniref:alcohol dehydrogenase catalytic domain-containing protein n=1 Tax=Streptomyces sp. NRRL F-5630 TaxID=1463864 RepID=UPI003D74232F